MSDRVGKRTSRHLATLCLTKWNSDRQPVQSHIESLIYSSPLAAADRHLAVMLVQGVLRQLQYLDAIISGFAKHPLKKMKPLTLMALRVGVFQLLFLDRIPDSAAVNETVKVLKTEKQPRWIINFANGVLRNISRKKYELPSTEKAGVKGGEVINHPDWLVERWQKRFGPEKTMDICRSNNEEPKLVIRVNTMVTEPESLAQQFRDIGIEVQEGRYLQEALILKSPTGPVAGLPGYNEGCFHVQDEAAQLAAFLLKPFFIEGEYLDACAGLGGKTLILAQLAPAEARLVAVDPSRTRFQRLQENIRRLDLEKKVTSFLGGIHELAQNNEMQFNGILVDAPCSGTGVIGRHPDIRWNRSVQDLQVYQQQQLEILQQSVHLLKPGGILAYATCSMEPEENEQVIEKFLADNPEFSLTDARKYLPGSAAALVTSEGYFSTTPAEGLDGFFGARLERETK